MKSKKIGMQALKIAIGSSLAIYIANLCGLKYSLAAGSVAPLTNGDYQKWKTVKIIGSEGCNIYNFSTYGTYYILSSRIRMDGIWYLCVFCGYYRRDAWMGSDDFRKCTDRNAFSGSQRF